MRHPEKLSRTLMLAGSILLAGCQAAQSPPAVELSAVDKPTVAPPPAAAAFSSLAEAQVRLKVVEAPTAAPRFRLLALPSVWTEALVTLHSPTVSSAYNPVQHARTLARGAFSGTPLQAGATFPALRPASDYVGRVFLRNEAGSIVTKRLAGSQGQTLTLNAGPNVLDFTVTINGQEAFYETGVATSSAGNATVDMVTPWVSTVAGNGVLATVDGIGTGASINGPANIAFDGNDTLYFTEYGAHYIRSLTISTGQVTTIVGNGTAGSVDGTGTAAQVCYPAGIAYDGSGNLYFSEQSGSHRIRRIALSTLQVATVAGGTQGFLDGTGTGAQFEYPGGLAADGAGNLYIADAINYAIRKMNLSTYAVTTLAGNNTAGNTDATGTSARFNVPEGVVYDPRGSLYIVDANNYRIRRLNLANNEVTTVAGSTLGSADGVGAAAQFSYFYNMAIDADGQLWVNDFNNHRIRKVDPLTRQVTTAAGSVSGQLDGLGAYARLANPNGTVFAKGAIYVGSGVSIRKLSKAGLHVVRGDTVSIATGLAASQPGVARLDVYLSGACYNAPRTLIRRFTSAESASWNSFVWNTAAANTANGASYDPTLLVPTLTGLSYQNGQLDFESYDSNGGLVGKGSVPIQAYGKPDITLRIQ